jgi:Alpha/beta hydrolase domain
MRLMPVPGGAGGACTSAGVPRRIEGRVVAALAGHYVESEYLTTGLARRYTGPVCGPVMAAAEPCQYATRVLVRRPRDPAAFSGRVLIEPFNTTYGVDLDALWCRIGSVLQSQGDAWIGVSGRAVSAESLKEFDEKRYAGIDFSTNEFEWDLLAAVGASVKTGDIDSPLCGLPVSYAYLGGYSQSGLDTATFATAFHRDAGLPDGSPIYDGYFPAAHAASLTAVGADRPALESAPVGPVDVPLIEVQPQTDVEGFSDSIGAQSFVIAGSASLRRGDSDNAHDLYRLYEVAGAPHVAHLDGCEGRGSSFPTAAFLRAAYRHLTRWAETGVAPPRASRIELADSGPVGAAAVDVHGNPLGGVRSPFVDVPLVRYAAHSTPGPLCRLAGNEEPLSAATLRRLYGDASGYLREFTTALDATIRAGFLIADDRSELLEMARSAAGTAFAENTVSEVAAP